MSVDARTVAVWEYGDPAGPVVLALHGIPACGAGFEWADAAAAERGLRVLAPDRPGVGRSSPQDGWRVADYPPMVAALADALGIDRYVVWGYSGGGPYAAAVAAATTPTSSRVAAVAISAGMGEVRDGWASVDDFEQTDAQLLRMSPRHPRRARALLRVAALGARVSPATAQRSFAAQLSSSDRDVLRSLGTPTEAMRLFTEALRRTTRGVVADYVALARPWGVDLAAATVPVSVWQGTDDPMVPPEHANGYAERIPGATLTWWPGEGHLATVTHVGAILDWLASRAVG